MSSTTGRDEGASPVPARAQSNIGTPGRWRDPWTRAATLAGAAPLPLALTAAGLSDVSGSSGGLDPGSTDAELLRVFAEFRDNEVVAASLFLIGAVATLVFLGPLWARLRTASEPLALVAVVGGVVSASLWLVTGAGWSLMAADAADFRDADAARFLMIANWDTARMLVAPYLVMVAASTAAGFRHRVFATWFNVVGLGFSVLLIIGLFPGSPAGAMGMLATAWVFLASLVLAWGKVPPG